MTIALEVRGLRRCFGSRVAVEDLDLTVHVGDVYGLLGPNGAGKTTVLRCVLGLIRRHAGEVRIFGSDDPVAQREQVGALVEIPRFHDWLSGVENLRIAQAYGGATGTDAATRRQEVLAQVDLQDRADDPVRAYSQGMRQRLGIARALLTRPRLLLLDEPTNGLDPRGMRDVRELVRSLAADGVTVLVSSHLLGEVEAVATRVGILQEGVMLAEGAVSELIRAVGVDVGTLEPDRAASVVEDLPWARVAQRGPDGLRVDLLERDCAALNTALVSAGVPVGRLVSVERSLEDLFLQLTGDPR